MALLAAGVRAQSTPPDPVVEVSYIYAAIMGTGSYTINGRRVSMLRVPLSWRQREVSDDAMGLRWLFPVVVGVDNLPDFGLGPIELPSELVTLTALPGLEFAFRVRPKQSPRN